MAKLTKSLVEKTGPGETHRFLWDDALPGFGVRVLPSGRRAFVVQYRTREGRQRRRVIGSYPIMTVDQARRLAREWLVTSQRGEDPAEVIDKNRKAATVGELCERFMTHHAMPHKKPRSAAEDRKLIDRLIVPALGNRKAVAVTHDDIEHLHKGLRRTPYQANRVLALLSTMFNRAELQIRKVKLNWVNPCHKIKRFSEERRRRYLAPSEFAALGRALSEAETSGASAAAVAAVRLLIFTGCRRMEVLTLTWDTVDIEGHRLRLKDSKTGAKDVYLSPPAIEVLRRLAPVEGNPYVIPGRRAGTHMQDLKSAWQRIRVRAGLAEVRLHDLRHSFASVGAGAGLSLPIIGALLGHSQPATTARYAHLASDPLQQAVDLVGARLADALAGEQPRGGEVVPLDRKA